MKKQRKANVSKIFLLSILTLLMLFPVEMEAQRSNRRKATTTATTRSNERSTRRSQNRSVTQATQDAAISASRSNNTGKNNSGQGGLTKISVEKPDLEEIRVTTLDPSSKNYFPKLMAKYLKNDTTMTPAEYRTLYLGYMFQEDYDPYRESPYTKYTEDMRDKSTYTRAEIDTIRKYTEKALLDNPFDLRQMSFLVHVLKERRKDMSAKIWEYRLENLLGAIKSTGTGEDADNAWYVIYPMHEYDMVQLLGYEAVDVDYIDPGIDYLVVEPDGSIKHRSPAKGFYFNVLVPQQQYLLKHPEEDEEESASL